MMLLETGDIKKLSHMSELQGAIKFRTIANIDDVLCRAHILGYPVERIYDDNETKLYAVYYEEDLDILCNEQLVVEDASSMFSNCDFRHIDISELDFSRNCATDYMFSNCIYLENIVFGEFGTQYVESMENMFSRAKSLKSLDLSKFDTSQVNNMALMFEYCNLKELDLRSFDTRKVKDMAFMFEYCRIGKLNLSNFNTSSVEDMTYMFKNSKIDELDISNFEISRTDIRGIFNKSEIRHAHIGVNNKRLMNELLLNSKVKSINNTAI